MRIAVVVPALLLAACESYTPARPPPTPTRPVMTSEQEPTAAPPPAKEERSVALVTYRGRTPLMHEQDKDDGDKVTSQLDFGAQTATITITRSSREFELSSGGRVIKKTIPQGTLALENGHWAAYVVAADWYANAQTDTPVKCWIPAQDATIDGTVRVEKQGDKRVVHLSLKGLEAVVEIEKGTVVAAHIPQQGVEVRTIEAGPPAVAKRPAPAAAEAIAIDLDRSGFHLKGDLWRPRAVKKAPVVVFVAGSGPTDRDGNSVIGLRTDLYRQLATAMIDRGYAAVLYDKRGVGESADGAPQTPVIDDFASDLVALVAWLRSRDDIGPITIAGHSEGGLVALLAAQKTNVDALALLSTAGRPLGVLVKEQIAKKLGDATAAKLDPAFAQIRAGKQPSDVPEALAPLFVPQVIPFWKSVLDLDPLPLVRAFKKPLVIVQGELDVQVSADDAKKLKGAAPAAKLVLVPTANHVLKVEASKDGDQTSYADPQKPLAPGVVDAIAAVVKK